jgi:hypothetical protein
MKPPRKGLFERMRRYVFRQRFRTPQARLRENIRRSMRPRRVYIQK